MSPESSPARFTLRKEYFGGLIYDSQTAKYELIDPKEYDFISEIAEHVEIALITCGSAEPKETTLKRDGRDFISLEKW